MKIIDKLLVLVMVLSITYAAIGTIGNFQAQANPFIISFSPDSSQIFFFEVPVYADLLNFSYMINVLNSSNVNNISLQVGNLTSITEFSYLSFISDNMTVNDPLQQEFIEPRGNNLVAAQCFNITEPSIVNSIILNQTATINGGNQLVQFSLHNSTNIGTDLNVSNVPNATVVGNSTTNDIGVLLDEWVLDGYNISVNISGFPTSVSQFKIDFDGSVLGPSVYCLAISCADCEVGNTTSFRRQNRHAQDGKEFAFDNGIQDGWTVIDSTPPNDFRALNYEIITSPENLSQQNVNISLTEFLLNVTKTCEVDGFDVLNGNCIVPFNFTSGVASRLSLLVLNSTYEFGIQECQPTVFNYTVLNFNYTDEVASIFISVDSAFDTNFVSNFTSGVNQSSAGVNSNSFCSNINPDDLPITGVMLGDITLTKTDFATSINSFPVGGGIPFSNINPTFQNLSLIRLNESTTVVFTWLSTAYNVISGSQEIFRCDGAGGKTLVSSVPIIDGDASANIELINTPYSYEVITQGQRFIDEDSFSKCHVETQTARTFFVNIEGVDIEDQLGLFNVQCNLTSPAEQTVLMEWSLNAEDNSPITGCIFADRVTPGGFAQIYVNCTSTDTSIERLIPNSGFNYFVTGKVFQSGFSKVCGQPLEFNFDGSNAALFGLSGILAIFFLIASTILFFSTTGQTQVVGTMIGFTIAAIIGLFPFGWVTVSSILIFLIIILLIGRHSRQPT